MYTGIKRTLIKIELTLLVFVVVDLYLEEDLVVIRKEDSDHKYANSYENEKIKLHCPR